MKPKVICFAPRSGDGPIADPCALLCAVRPLVQAGYDVKIIQSEKGVDFRKEIVREAKDAVAFGVSCITSSAIIEAIEATNFFKVSNPEAMVVWGGWHPSILASETIEGHSGIDVVVRGQGERAFLELVDRRDCKSEWRRVLGTTFWYNGGIVNTPNRSLEDVNRFGEMPYHLVDIEKNVRVSRYGKRTIRMTTSQGCPHRCGFCVEPTVFNRRWYGLKADRVVSEVGALVDRYGIDSVIFTDSNFFTDPRRAHSIAEGFLQRGLCVKWGDCNGRTHQLLRMPKETWKLLARSGLKTILVGAESASDDALALIKKDCTVEETVELTKLANSYGIDVVLSMMVGLPYPNRTHAQLAHQTRVEFHAALDLIDCVQNNGTGVWNHFLLFDYTPYPGTPLFRNAVTLGVKPPKTLAEWAQFELNNDILPWIPKDISLKSEMLSTYIFFWMSGAPLEQLRKNPVYYIVGKLIQLLCRVRWKLKWFSLPIDFKVFKKIMKVWKP